MGFSWLLVTQSWMQIYCQKNVEGEASNGLCLTRLVEMGWLTSWALRYWLPSSLSLYTRRKRRRLLANLQSWEKEVSRERVRGILEQIVVCPGLLDAPRPLKRFLLRFTLLHLETYLYGLSRKCCHKGCRTGLPPSHVPLKIILFSRYCVKPWGKGHSTDVFPMYKKKTSVVTFGTNSASCIPYELPLGHLILDMGRTEVDREENEGEAHHVSAQDRIRKPLWFEIFIEELMPSSSKCCQSPSGSSWWGRLTRSQRTWPGMGCIGRSAPACHRNRLCHHCHCLWVSHFHRNQHCCCHRGHNDEEKLTENCSRSLWRKLPWDSGASNLAKNRLTQKLLWWWW